MMTRCNQSLLVYFSILILYASLIAFVSISVHAQSGVSTSSTELTGACLVDSSENIVKDSSETDVYVGAFPSSTSCYADTPIVCDDGSHPPCATLPERTCESDSRSPCVLPEEPCDDGSHPPCATQPERTCADSSQRPCSLPPDAPWLSYLLGSLLTGGVCWWIYMQSNITARWHIGNQLIKFHGTNRITSEVDFKLVWKGSEQVIPTDNADQLIIAERCENE